VKHKKDRIEIFYETGIQMKSSIFMTINSFQGLPPVKQLLSNISKDYQLTCIQCNIQNFENFFDQRNIINYSILNFKSSQDFNSQNITHKIVKYIWLPFYFFRSYFLKRSSNVTIYAIDLYCIFIAILAKRKSTKIVYLQYEMIEPNGLNKFDKYLLRFIQKKSEKIDLIITPEINRTKYLKKIFHKSNDHSFLTIPNTNNFNKTNKSIAIRGAKTIVTHVGSIGLNHYIKLYLEAITKMDSHKYEFRFIGLLSDEVVELISSYQKSNILYIDQVLHSDLPKYYLETDIGVILYKDVSLNHRFCAPNKLYEYWSFGIPVLGHHLPGLQSVFTETFLGELIDMSIPTNIIEAISKLQLIDNREIIADFFQSHLRLDNYFNGLNLVLN
jgi:glycosyltransferase involved in cell wall biosynthesis